jgi:hypothetical protein
MPPASPSAAAAAAGDAAPPAAGAGAAGQQGRQADASSASSAAAAAQVASAVIAATRDPQLAAGLPALLSDVAAGLTTADLRPAGGAAARALLSACLAGQEELGGAAGAGIERLEELLVAVLEVVAAAAGDAAAPAGRGRAAASYVPGARAGALQLLLRVCAALVQGYLRESFRPERVWLRAPCGGGRGTLPLPLAMTKLPARVMRAANEAAELQVLTEVRLALQDATQGSWMVEPA